MINPYSRHSLSPRHGNDPPATTAVVVATVGGYSSRLLRMTADEGGVGEGTRLTSGRMCTCVLSPSSASIDLYFYLPFLLPATHSDLFLNRWLVFIFLATQLHLHHSSFHHTYSISPLSSSNPSIFHAIIYSFMPLSIPAPSCFPVHPRSISTSQQAPSGACTPHERKLRERIEILMAPAFRTLRGGSAAAPRQRV